jgi:hypothetical protein
MSEYATETVDTDVGAEPSYEPAAEPGYELANITQEEWQQFQHERAALLDWFSEQQSAQTHEDELAYREQLEELYWTDPGAAMRAMLEQALAQHLGPLQEYIAEQEQAELEAAGEDEAEDILLENGVREEELDDALVVANELFPQMAMQYAEQWQHLYDQVRGTGDPEAVAQWVAEARRNIAVAALQQAAGYLRAGEHEAQLGEFYRGGGSVPDRLFGGAEVGQGSRGEYHAGGSVTDRMFSGGA